MTTIAVKDGVMAADSRITGDGSFWSTHKIQRINTNSLAAYCGEAFVGLTVIQWLRSRRNPADLHKIIPPDSRDDAHIVELTPAGIFVWNGYGIPLKLHGACFATGSGGRRQCPRCSTETRQKPPYAWLQGWMSAPACQSRLSI